MNMGIVGFGVMGSNHKRVYEKIGHSVTDIYDPFVFPAKSLEDFIKQCRKNKVKGISICNPSNKHVEISLKILSEIPNIYLLIEKPIAIELEESKKLIPYTDRILVGHIEQFNRAVIEFRQWVDEGKFGKIFSIRTKRANNIPSREQIKDVATDLLVHDIEVVNSIVGKTLTFKKFIKQSTNNNKVYDHAHAILQYEDVICYCEANWVSPIKERYLKVYSTNGLIELNYSRQTINLTDTQGNSKELLSNDGYEEPLVKELQHFTDIILNYVRPQVTVETGIRVLEILNEDI